MTVNIGSTAVNDMSEHKQNLSAYLDDNLSDEEQRTLQLDAAGDTVHHYQLIGEAMRGQVSELSLLDVSAQVRAAIADEPLLQQPPTAVTHSSEAPRKPSLLGGLFDSLADWMRPAAGLAVAASVAMIVIVSLQNDDAAPNAKNQLVAQQPVPSVRANLAQLPKASNIVPVSNQRTAGRADLDRYLQQHSEFAARDTAQGRMPYVRAVGYETH